MNVVLILLRTIGLPPVAGVIALGATSGITYVFSHFLRIPPTVELITGVGIAVGLVVAASMYVIRRIAGNR